MDSTGVISLLTDSSDRVHDLSGYFTKTLSDNRFWTYFKLIKSPADGHCLIHAIVTVLIFLNHNIQDHCTLTNLSGNVIITMRNICQISSVLLTIFIIK